MATILALVLSTTAHAASITVNSLTDTDAPGDCVLRDAITAANTMTATNGCAAGTGNDTINFSVSGTITLASTLPQITDSLLTINGPASTGITIDGGGNVQVMTVKSGATLNLNHLTIANGFNCGSICGTSDSFGGGVKNAGTLTITNSTFSDNCADVGSGIFNEGMLTVTDSTFSHNVAQSSGSGIFNEGTLTVANSTFSHNVAQSVGGGIVNGDGKTLTITNSTFSGNGAGFGGGIWSSGTVTVTNNTFSHNVAQSVGGGIWSNGTVMVTNSTFSGNGADFGSGIENEGTLTVTNSTFSQNVARSSGGGIENTGTLTATNSTFSGNDADFGGGIFNEEMVTVTNSTFSGNSAGFGSGIFNEETLTVTNGTFSGNGAGFGSGIDNEGKASVKSTIMAASSCAGRITDVGYNISDDTTCRFVKTGSAKNGDSVNPLLSPAGLANNGGPTQTIALLDGSPAIDAIPLAACTDQASPPNPIITDQRLFPRPDAGETNCNIGAYEMQDKPFLPFSGFSASLKINPDTGGFYLAGRFTLGAGGTIDPVKQPVAFSVGSYAVRLPAGSFVKYSNGYFYQKTVNGVFFCVFLKFTPYPWVYQLLVERNGSTITDSLSPVPVTLTVGDDSGSIQMNATFD
ncbi:MAG: right-handed parallel beta-helix repeat-containing protein [Deltaproteobacteria bacterium]|nr:right-handed parallel beta-helix repeat-containing protein [Deltaproteobacteria bacterium]